MGKRWKNVLVRVFYLAFSLCFLRVVLWIASGGYYGYGVLAGPLCAAAALGLLQGAFSPGGNGGFRPAPYLAVFGLLLFLVWWEARWRYFSGYIPVIYLAAVPGAEPMSRRLKRAFRRLRG